MTHGVGIHRRTILSRCGNRWKSSHRQISNPPSLPVSSVPSVSLFPWRPVEGQAPHRCFLPFPMSTQPVRYFSSSHEEKNDNDNDDDDDDNDDEEEDEDLQKRNKSIRMNPHGISHQILPNQMVYKTNPKTGTTKKVHQVAIGSFWMMKDLRDTDNKPILSNTSLIPAGEAQLFPPLKGLTSLTGKPAELPELLIKHDGTSETSCTLVAISYKDFGYKMLPPWTIPFEKSFGQNPKASVLHLTITEGTLLRLLRGFLTRSMIQNTPLEQQDTTFLHFGNVEEFRDVLRMHNTLTGYVVLVDGLGRVRWMGSGEPVMTKSKGGEEESEELTVLMESAKELLYDASKDTPKRHTQTSNRRRKVPTGRIGRKTTSTG